MADRVKPVRRGGGSMKVDPSGWRGRVTATKPLSEDGWFFYRSTILRVIDEEIGDTPWYSVDQSPPGSDWAVFRAGMEAALAKLRARFEGAE